MPTRRYTLSTLPCLPLLLAVACGGDPNDQGAGQQGKGDTASRQMYKCVGVCAKTGTLPGCDFTMLLDYTDRESSGWGFGAAAALDDLRQTCADQGYNHEAYESPYFLNVNPDRWCDSGGKRYNETREGWLVKLYPVSCKVVPEPDVQALCGNGSCEPGEDSASCPWDC